MPTSFWCVYIKDQADETYLGVYHFFMLNDLDSLNSYIWTVDVSEMFGVDLDHNKLHCKEQFYYHCNSPKSAG